MSIWQFRSYKPVQQSFTFAKDYEKGYRGIVSRLGMRLNHRKIKETAIGLVGIGMGFLLGYNAKPQSTLEQPQHQQIIKIEPIRKPIDIMIEHSLWETGKHAYDKAEEQFRASHSNAKLKRVFIEYESRLGENITYELAREASDRKIASTVRHIQEANRDRDYRIKGPNLIRDGNYRGDKFIGKGTVRHTRVGELDDGLHDWVKKEYSVRVIAEGEISINAYKSKTMLPDPIEYARRFNYGLGVLGAGIGIASLLYVNKQVANISCRSTFMSIDDICEATGVCASVLRDRCGSRRKMQEQYRSKRRMRAKSLREEGLSYRQIAQEMGVSYSTARRDILK